MKVWIIEYSDSAGIARDCYPDFCYSRAEAERIAPEFMTELNACDSGRWAQSWRIAEEEVEPDFGGRSPSCTHAACGGMGGPSP